MVPRWSPMFPKWPYGHILYRTLSHLVPGPGTPCTRPWSTLCQTLPHLVPDPGAPCARPCHTLYQTLPVHREQGAGRSPAPCEYYLNRTIRCFHENSYYVSMWFYNHFMICKSNCKLISWNIFSIVRVHFCFFHTFEYNGFWDESNFILYIAGT